jgi:hypothetical protein
MNAALAILSLALIIMAVATLSTSATHQRERAAYEALISAQRAQIISLTNLANIQAATIAKYERAIR